ncbi:DUF2357 domain-containing protein [Mammaliicoccus lentus]|uniref:DUF2357 domain-containing protein n=1 Tax=Mammaliicoccus lentus TaxID=42858 RepID=UPI00374FC128
MDIHSNVSLIKSIKTSNNQFHDEYYEIKFFESIDQINFETDIIKITEYHNLKISNQTDNISNLYFDIFDIVESDDLKEDEYGNRYLSNGTVSLINYQNNQINNILVPGYYLLRLESDRIYYSVLEVIPKDLSKLEWKKLYDEINDFVNGLSRSLLNKNNSKVTLNRKNNNIYEKINYLQANYKSIILALNQIKNNPRHNIRKNYNWVRKNERPPIDKKSIKYQTKHPNMKEYLYSYKRYTNYNIQENLWLKFVIEELLKMINNIQNELNSIMEENEEKSYSKYYSISETAKQTNYITEKQLKEILIIKNGLVNIIKQEWYEDIEKKRYVAPSHASLMDFNYNVIFKWYKDFNKSKLDIKFSEKIQSAWKRTDELYEIWCFIKLIQKLEDLGFEPIKGWIFDKNENNELEDETVIVLKKEHIILNLHYNSYIRKNSKDTTLTHPLYTNAKNNKPDIRIDIHINDIYMKSIPIDAKYRKLRNIMNKDKGALNQLLAYRDHPRSILHLEGAKEFRKNNHTVINKVAILYPKDENNKSKSKIYTEDHNLEFFEMSPGYFAEEFIEMLEKEFRDMYDLYMDTY